jgi:hypothetical protein
MSDDSEPIWIDKEQVLYIHSEAIREKGGDANAQSRRSHPVALHAGQNQCQWPATAIKLRQT